MSPDPSRPASNVFVQQKQDDIFYSTLNAFLTFATNLISNGIKKRYEQIKRR